ncbi:hypothetical protein FMUND_15504 [Fusarium mundagurra]|uniref:Uncharacterized protein n=1 Tax=Fusarium mundagurra TaxID=1567541 RepID=A0A8H6CY22_9HYPO|nr:hypothetical protein FMUND_15504 [Fusarium mundagurra]
MMPSNQQLSTDSIGHLVLEDCQQVMPKPTMSSILEESDEVHLLSSMSKASPLKEGPKPISKYGKRKRKSSETQPLPAGDTPYKRRSITLPRPAQPSVRKGRNLNSRSGNTEGLHERDVTVAKPAEPAVPKEAASGSNVQCCSPEFTHEFRIQCLSDASIRWPRCAGVELRNFAAQAMADDRMLCLCQRSLGLEAGYQCVECVVMGAMANTGNGDLCRALLF